MLYEGPGTVQRLMNGMNYGPLWTDRYPLAIVLHTTETAGLPGYSNGTIAPQLTIHPRNRRVWQHIRLDSRAGSLRGSSMVFRDTSVRTVMNEKAIQVEIIGYSSKAVAYDNPDARTWVGDFTDEDYDFISEVVHYLKDELNIGDAIHARKSGLSWTYGIQSPYRMTPDKWEAFNGLTAHGGVFGQLHWDTGVLDLPRIWTPTAKPAPTPTPAPEVDSVMTKLPTLRLNDGFKAGRPSLKPHVQRAQAVLAIEGFIASNTFNSRHQPDGLFGSGTLAAVRAFQKARGLAVDGIIGEKTWQKLMRV